jgi:acyl dehydratase
VTSGEAAKAFTPAEPFRMVVEEGKIREFARATASPCAEHLASENPVTPLTFLASHRLWMIDDRHSGWHGIHRDFRYLLHGQEEFTFHGPLPVSGTVLTVRQSIERQYEKRGRRGGTMVFTDLVTRFWTESGNEGPPLAEERSVLISTEPPAAGAPAGTSEPARAPVEAVEAVEVVQVVAAPGELVFDTVQPALTITDFVKYQGASGDFNPIHHDTAFAQSSGKPGPFAVGMLAAAVAANQLTAVAGDVPVHRYRVRWSEIAWPGDALRYQGVRTGATSYRIDVTRPDGRNHLTAWADTTG